jgi:GH43 family beta-xylosidase
MKITVFWNVAVCSLVNMYHYFRGSCSLHLQGRRDTLTLKMEAAVFSKTLVDVSLYGFTVQGTVILILQMYKYFFTLSSSASLEN